MREMPMIFDREKWIGRAADEDISVRHKRGEAADQCSGASEFSTEGNKAQAAAEQDVSERIHRRASIRAPDALANAQGASSCRRDACVTGSPAIRFLL